MKFYEELMADLHLVNDDPSIVPNSPIFKENRHDQTILSMLLKASMASFEHCSRYPGPPQWTPKLHPVYGIEGLRVKAGRYGYSLPRVVVLPGVKDPPRMVKGGQKGKGKDLRL